MSVADPASSPCCSRHGLTQAIGVDADREMLAEAARQAAQAKIENVQWQQLRAEDLPAGLGSFRVISFAQSFHWMDQPRVARTALSMLDDDGFCVHVDARTPSRRRKRCGTASPQTATRGNR